MKNIISNVVACVLLYSLVVLSIGLAFYLQISFISYHGFINFILLLVEGSLNLFPALMALLSKHIQDFIHRIREKRLPCMAVGMTRYAFHRIVVSGEPITAIWLSCVLLFTISFLILFVVTTSLQSVLDAILAACSSATLELGLMHYHPIVTDWLKYLSTQHPCDPKNSNSLV